MNDNIEILKPTGLHGCRCHPFDSWQEHDLFHKQKIIVGTKYIIRHSQKICIAQGFDEEFKDYVKVFVEPFDCPRCNQKEHKSNLIPMNNEELLVIENEI